MPVCFISQPLQSPAPALHSNLLSHSSRHTLTPTLTPTLSFSFILHLHPNLSLRLALSPSKLLLLAGAAVVWRLLFFFPTR